MTLRDIVVLITNSALSSGKLFFIIACIGILPWAFAMKDVPQQVLGLFSGMLDRPWLILLTINIFLFAPIFVPLTSAVGIDPLQFAIIFLLNF